MSKVSLLISFLFIVCACSEHEDVLSVDQSSVSLGLSHPEREIHVSGRWDRFSIHCNKFVEFITTDDKGKVTMTNNNFSSVKGDGSISIESNSCNISVSRKGKKLLINMSYMLDPQGDEFIIKVYNSNESVSVPVTVSQTHKFEIEDITYDLETPVPDEDRTYEKVISSTTHPPLNAPGYQPYFYVGVGQMETQAEFFFQENSEPYIFDILKRYDSYYIPIPSSTGNPSSPWTMAGDMMKLSNIARNITIHFFPSQPVEVLLPGNSSVRMTMIALMQCMYFQCSMKVYNPVSSQRQILSGILKIDMPMRIDGEYELLNE